MARLFLFLETEHCYIFNVVFIVSRQASNNIILNHIIPIKNKIKDKKTKTHYTQQLTEHYDIYTAIYIVHTDIIPSYYSEFWHPQP